ncbi:MAG: hypothetical protein P0Y65_02000 [Candidatus Devosia phytovorans]|uniref:Uncharacterized protein n=1 Tax=Candidatus Devosia phytovorans TaxID=3121372 RepID=A0AAJ6B183_9HYPH|nr:hypothetical protein [Devosia sp.]WEK05049.1 MAG: hypothetical protein P0Y65_02000 [Devosia sp.]
MGEIIVTWAPLVLIVIAVAITGRMSVKSYSNHVARVEEINKDLVVMTQEMVAELRAIKQLLKDQK